MKRVNEHRSVELTYDIKGQLTNREKIDNKSLAAR